MSVITYRDGVLAADSRATTGDTPHDQSPKLHAFAYAGRYVLMGGAGRKPAQMDLLRHFLTAPRYGGMPPSLHGVEATLLVVELLPDADQYRVWHVGCDGSQLEKTRHYWAVGCGADYALGAMFHGATAIGAVDAAIAHDVYCGGAIQSERIATWLAHAGSESGRALFEPFEVPAPAPLGGLRGYSWSGDPADFGTRAIDTPTATPEPAP